MTDYTRSGNVLLLNYVLRETHDSLKSTVSTEINFLVRLKKANDITLSLNLKAPQKILKQIWALINHLRGKVKESVSPQFIVDGISITNKDTITNKFNHYFYSLAENLYKCTERHTKFHWIHTQCWEVIYIPRRYKSWRNTKYYKGI